MSARFVIDDGQHRRAGIEGACARTRNRGRDDCGLLLHGHRAKAGSTMFADLDRYAIRPSTSLSIVCDSGTNRPDRGGA